MKKVIVLGASSGIGEYVSRRFAEDGFEVGIAARREDRLRELQEEFPGSVHIERIDVAGDDIEKGLESLIDKLGGVDIFLYSSGYGKVNKDLDLDIETNTVDVNVYGFTRAINYIYKYFAGRGGGHIACISSVAATRDIGISASYSATKRFQLMYMRSIRKIGIKQGIKLKTTIIQPGFIRTDFIKDSNYLLTTNLDRGGRLIYRAIIKEKQRVYVPGYWRVIVGLWLCIPEIIWKRGI